jgi:uncharacterized protein YbjT (DUF2867 family)
MEHARAAARTIMVSATHKVFVTGGTGYVGSRLVPELLLRGHSVRALARPGSEARLPPGCSCVSGDALDAATYQGLLDGADTLIHLVGVPHPNPAKAAQFRSVDLVSAKAALAAARYAGVRHLIYLSVAQPAPLMHAYIAARAEAEATIRASGIDATLVRPWYVLGAGHRWPYALLPLYWLAERLPATRHDARRLGLVTLDQLVSTLVRSVESPPSGVRIVEVSEIRRAGRT